MSPPSDDLLLSLQTSLRNALTTFGAGSIQYRNIKLMVDEHMARLAMEGLSLSLGEAQKVDGDVCMD